MVNVKVTPQISSNTDSKSPITNTIASTSNPTSFNPDNIYLQKPKTSVILNLPDVQVSFTGAEAQAWWQNITYRISDLNESDILQSCRRKFGQIDDVYRNGDKISCMVIRRTGNTSNSYDVQFNGNVIINGKYSGSMDGGVSSKSFSKDNTTLTIYRSMLSTNEACDLKWPWKGTWAGDGGSSCYDSYNAWR